VFATLARLIANRTVAWVTVLVVLCVAAGSALLARRVVHEDDLLAFLPRDNAQMQAFQDINKRFGGLDVGLVGIATDDALAPDFLARLQRVTGELRDTRGLSNVLSLANVVDFVPDKERGGIVTSHLVDALPRTKAEVEALRKKVLSRDLVVGNLVSPDSRAVLLYCFLSFGADAKTVIAQIRKVVDAGFPKEQKYWGGNPFISSYSYNAAQDDMRKLTPWAGLAIILIMMIAFRDITATLLALISTGIGIVFSVGMMGALGVRFNIVLGSMPIIMLALGSAYAIHVLARYYSLAKDCDTETAVARTVTSVGPTVLAAGLTTVISLLSFTFMDIQPMRTFGLFTAIGLTAKLILSLTFIPAVVRLLNLKRKPAASLALRRLMAGIAGYARRHRLAVGGVLGAFAIGSAALAVRVNPNLDSSAFFSPGSPPDLAERYLGEHFGGSQFIQLEVQGDLSDPGTLREVQRLADELARMPHIASVTHVGQAMAQINNAMTGQRRIPDTAAQAKLLYSFLASDSSVSQLVTTDHKRALIQAKLDVNRADDVNPVLAEVERWVAKQPRRFIAAQVTSGPRADEARTRGEAIVLARILAAAHASRLTLDAAAEDRLRRAIATAPTRVDPAPVEAAIVRFLRSSESPVALAAAEGGEDPARKVAAALVKLGPGAPESALGPAIAGALGKPESDAAVQDLVLGVLAPLGEGWSSERALTHARELTATAGLRLPEGRLGEYLRGALAAALLDLRAPTAALPVAEGGSELIYTVSGQPVMNRGLSRSVVGNQIKSLAFALLFVLVIMTLLFRSLLSAFLGMTPAVLTLLGIYGAMGLFKVRLDIGTSMLGSMIIGAGVDYAIHLIGAWRAPASGDLVEAATVAGDRAGLAVWTNAVMVAAAYFVLTLGTSRPLKVVGGLTGAAMLVGAVACFVAIPVLARRRSYRRHAAEEEIEPAPLHQPTESPADR